MSAHLNDFLKIYFPHMKVAYSVAAVWIKWGQFSLTSRRFYFELCWVDAQYISTSPSWKMGSWQEECELCSQQLISWNNYIERKKVEDTVLKTLFKKKKIFISYLDFHKSLAELTPAPTEFSISALHEVLGPINEQLLKHQACVRIIW